MTAGGKEIKNKDILQLLEGAWEPSQVAVIHCRGHQKGTDYVSRGNHPDDQVAKRTAEKLSSPGVPEQTTKLVLAPEPPPSPNYTKEEEQWAKD
jgi:hypothetical protein